MKDYKTPEHVRLWAKEKRDRIKAAGGLEYEKLLKKERFARAVFRKKHPDRIYKDRRKRRRFFKVHLCHVARLRARKAGMGATITVADLIWPTHCPVLGIELKYPFRVGEGGDWKRPDRPSLDRWDNTKGYVPGNVFVISLRANILKNDATAEELRRIADYAERGLGGAL